MSSHTKILANQHNSLKSTGPKTLQGKTATSQNAVKHGLSAQQAVISTEDQTEYELYRQDFLEVLNPETSMESMLAERIVNLSWRLKRAAYIQNQTIDALNTPKPVHPRLAKLQKQYFFNNSNDSQSSDFPLGQLAIKDFSNGRVLEKLLMYERRLESSLYKTIIELQRLNLLKNLKKDTLTELDPESTRLIFKENSGEKQLANYQNNL